MSSRIFVAVLFAVCLAACSSKDAAGDAGTAAVSLASLPVTLEGELSSEVGDGGEDEAGNADHFGELTVNGKAIPVMLSQGVITGAGLGDLVEGARVRATIGRTVEGVDGLYQITALQKL